MAGGALAHIEEMIMKRKKLLVADLTWCACPEQKVKIQVELFRPGTENYTLRDILRDPFSPLDRYVIWSGAAGKLPERILKMRIEEWEVGSGENADTLYICVDENSFTREEQERIAQSGQTHLRDS